MIDALPWAAKLISGECVVSDVPKALLLKDDIPASLADYGKDPRSTLLSRPDCVMLEVQPGHCLEQCRYVLAVLRAIKMQCSINSHSNLYNLDISACPINEV